jgi:hypothetical protein
MFQDEGVIGLSVSLTVENDLEVDNDGNFYLVTLFYQDENSEPCESRMLFEDVVDNLMEFYRDENLAYGIGQIYQIANGLERAVNRLRTTADMMEVSPIYPDDSDPESYTDDGMYEDNSYDQF